MSNLTDTIRAYLARSFKGYDLEEDEDIFSLGFVNSLFAMQLVLFLEQTFGISIDNEDLDLDNFRSIRALASLVERKQASTTAVAAI
jgi:acyl carrier protein